MRFIAALAFYLRIFSTLRCKFYGIDFDRRCKPTPQQPGSVRLPTPDSQRHCDDSRLERSVQRHVAAFTGIRSGRTQKEFHSSSVCCPVTRKQLIRLVSKRALCEPFAVSLVGAVGTESAVSTYRPLDHAVGLPAGQGADSHRYPRTLRRHPALTDDSERACQPCRFRDDPVDTGRHHRFHRPLIRPL